MQISAPWLDAPATQRVLRSLEAGGHQACAVGGCVRNTLIGAPVADVDMATDALPGRVTELLEAEGLRVVPTGIEHGTVTAICDGTPFEITTFRRDVETDGRHAVVAHATDIQDDAQRRDFTMNALYARADGTVLDPTGLGLADAAARHLRFVGEPAQRIREDYLRILRFFRFQAWYGDVDQGPDPEALAACASEAAGIETLSAERVGAEMKKLLAAPDPAPAVASMHHTGVLGRVLPGADPHALAPLVWLEGTTDTPAATLRRMVALGPAALADAANRLRLSRHEAKALGVLLAHLGTPEPSVELGYRLGAEVARDVTLLRAALLEMLLPTGWQAEVARGAAARFPLKAADLMPALKGAELGARLKALEAIWLAEDLAPDREALLARP